MGERSLDLLRVSTTSSPLAQGKSLRTGAGSPYHGQREVHELDRIGEGYSHPTERVSVDPFQNWLRVMFSNLLGHFPKQRHGELGGGLGPEGRWINLDKRLG